MTDAKESAAALRRRAHIVEACRARIVRALELNRTLGLVEPELLEFLPSTGSDIDWLAEHIARAIEGVLDAYRYPADNRGAMAVRLAEHWHLVEAPADQDRHLLNRELIEEGKATALDIYGLTMIAHIEYKAMQQGKLPPRIMWPSNVSLDDVAATIERGRDPRAKIIARTVRAGLWYVAGEVLGMNRKDCIALRPEAYRFITTELGEAASKLFAIDHTTDPVGRALFAMIVGAPDLRAALGLRGTIEEIVGIESRARKAALEPATIVDDPEFRAALESPVAIVDDPELRAALDSPFHPSTAALVAWAAKVVLDAQTKARAFALPSRRDARVAFDFLARQKTLCADGRADQVEALRGGGVRLAWDGRPRAEQLRFAFASLDMSMSLALGIKDELGVEGLRDYLILHRMAAEHGRSGTFVWTWAQHRKATRHHTRIRAGNVDDAATCEAVVQRIHRLARAQLHVEVEHDGRRAWKVIGDDPLVFIGGGVERKGGPIEGLKLRLNKALYAGASRDAKSPHYTMIPEAVLELPAAALCLATLLVFQWRRTLDDGGTVELDEDTVLRLMDETSLTATRHQARAAGKMRRTLDDVVRAMGDGCTWEPVEGGKVRIAPPTWWVDHAVHGAPMPHPLPPAQHPRTGVELVAWRREHKLTQAEAAAALGVGERTIRNAEARGSDALPRSFVDVPWGAPRRALPKGRA